MTDEGDKLETRPSTEKAGNVLDLDPAALPPCTPENIISGKPCILFKKPYLKIHFPGHKAPAKQSEEKTNSVEWGKSDE